MIQQPAHVEDIPELAERPSAADEADIMAAAPLSARRRFLRRFKSNRGAMIAFGFIVFLTIIAIIGPWIAPYDPNQQDLANTLADPFTDGHFLGTDELGRDTLSRLIVAARVAMLASAQAVTIAMILGVVPGLLAGYIGGWFDLIIMRITDAVQSFPPLILAIAVVGILGPGLRNAMLAVGIIFFPNFLRIVRGSVLEVREETFIEASRSIGTPTMRIVRTRILPNVLPPLLVQISLAAGFALLAEASLSFLGLGVELPDSSWGQMLGRAYNNFSRQPWLIVWPGVTIALTVLAYNVMGDGLRDSIGREVRREK
jgi:ABC-type dipeptide/oligopeptide/nickel transport system permease subunit